MLQTGAKGTSKKKYASEKEEKRFKLFRERGIFLKVFFHFKFF